MTTSPEELLDERAIAKLTGRARATLQKDRLYGRGIPFVRIGRLVRYRRSDYEHYIAGLPAFKSTTEADCAKSKAGGGQ